MGRTSAGCFVDQPLRTLIGDRTAEALASGWGLRTVADLLGHYPRRYATRGELTDLSALRPGDLATVLARVEQVRRTPMRQRRGDVLRVVVTDGRHRLELAYFNQSWRQRELYPGRVGLFAGKVELVARRLQLSHPDYQLIDADPDVRADLSADLAAGLGTQPGDRVQGLPAFAGTIIPVYPGTATLPSWRVAQALRIALDALDTAQVDDPLPAEIRLDRGLVGLVEAWRGIHRPAEAPDIERATARLRFDEAFVLQVALAQRRHATRRARARPRRTVPGGLLDALDSALPFTLTGEQLAAGRVILDELAGQQPMSRLLQGEVGSGKTVVAVRAMVATVDAGGQAVLLAPTEVLATQHHGSVLALLGVLASEPGALVEAGRVRVGLLDGSLSAAARRRLLEQIATRDVDVIIGTHAVLEPDVSFADLGLVVVDEQHRFGVAQRDALRTRGEHPPHLLVMTATPIPRTVAMTVFGDLDVLTLRERPAAHAPVATHLVPARRKPHYRERVWARVREEVAAGRQGYVVCPRIGGEPDPDGADDPVEGAGPAEGSDGRLEADPSGAAALEVAEMLRGGPLAGLRVGVLHGRLSAREKTTVLREFATSHLDVLVATTVVEVGLDVPNATVMVVLDADHFGVSQLHQLRGRVGRGRHPGLCLLVSEVGEATGAWARLVAVAGTTDGFALAEADLQLRREGDVLGARQSGAASSLRLLEVGRHAEVIREARRLARDLVDADPALAASPGLDAAVARAVTDARGDWLERG
ncbi:MAG: ATP-dependent DNA helicase RecG [Actinomycetes bacterium]